MPTATLTIPARSAAFDAALEGLTRVDERLLATGKFPPLYSAGVVYRTEPREVWRHVADVYTEGWGDCEDLAAWRAAELRVSGQDPDARVGTYRSGRRRYHAVVVLGDGSIEDPSRRLGMKAPRRRKRPNMSQPDLLGEDLDGIEGLSQCEGLADAVLGEDDGDEGDTEYDPDGPPPGQQDEEEGQSQQDEADAEPDAVVAPDPTPNDPDVTYDVKPTAKGPNGGGFRGVARVPLRTGRALLTASSVKPTRQLAARGALKLASRAATTQAAKALIPPQARLALTAIRSPAGRAAMRAGKRLARFGLRKLRKRYVPRR